MQAFHVHKYVSCHITCKTAHLRCGSRMVNSWKPRYLRSLEDVNRSPSTTVAQNASSWPGRAGCVDGFPPAACAQCHDVWSAACHCLPTVGPHRSLVLTSQCSPVWGQSQAAAAPAPLATACAAVGAPPTWHGTPAAASPGGWVRRRPLRPGLKRHTPWCGCRRPKQAGRRCLRQAAAHTTPAAAAASAATGAAPTAAPASEQ